MDNKNCKYWMNGETQQECQYAYPDCRGCKYYEDLGGSEDRIQELEQ